MGDAGVKWSALYWLLFAFAGFCFIVVCLLPETYAPVILAKRAARLRKENPGEPWWAPCTYPAYYAPLSVTCMLISIPSTLLDQKWIANDRASAHARTMSV